MQTQVAAGQTPARYGILIWAATLIVGIGLALTAQFILDGWADSSDSAHQAQHALLFWSGLMTGAAVLRLYQLGKSAA